MQPDQFGDVNSFLVRGYFIPKSAEPALFFAFLEGRRFVEAVSSRPSCIEYIRHDVREGVLCEDRVFFQDPAIPGHAILHRPPQSPLLFDYFLQSRRLKGPTYGAHSTTIAAQQVLTDIAPALGDFYDIEEYWHLGCRFDKTRNVHLSLPVNLP